MWSAPLLLAFFSDQRGILHSKSIDQKAEETESSIAHREMFENRHCCINSKLGDQHTRSGVTSHGLTATGCSQKLNATEPPRNLF
jgi:hypothetical protein